MTWLRRSLFALCSMFLLGFSVSASASLVRVPVASFASSATTYQAQPSLWLLGVAIRHNGFVTVHVYAGNLTQLTDPDTGITHYTYSGFGELALTTKANGDTLSYQYDALGRRTTDVSQANGQSSTRTWVYDLDAGHACGSSATGLAYGQLACRTAPGFAERYQYDSLARQSQAITQLTDKAGLAHNYTRQYAYDAYSRLLTSTWPNGNTSHWQYNLAGYPSGVEDAQQQWLYGINAQNAWNRPTDISLAGGAIQQTAASDATSGRPLSLATQASGAALQGDTWQWWSNGSMAGRSTLTASGNRTDAFSYDGLERLTQASASGAVTSTDTASYSTSGNLTNKTGITGSYSYGSSQPHAVVSAGGTTYGYDASGNMTQRGATNVTYNALGQPLSFYHVTDEVTRFAYDSDHNRYYQWAKLSNGDTQETFYVGASYEERITHQVGGSTSKTQYAYVNDAVLQVTDAGPTPTTETRYLLRNALHSVEAVLNSQGQLLERLSYDTWGKPDATPQYTTRSYTGQEYLPTLGLLHLNGRVYDPDLGRFLSADPLVQAPDFSQSYNRYSYVWNNPVSAWDPSGYELKPIAGDDVWLGGAFMPEQLFLTNLVNLNAPTSSWDVGVGVAKGAGSFSLPAFESNLIFAPGLLSTNWILNYVTGHGLDYYLSPSSLDQQYGAGLFSIGSIMIPAGGELTLLKFGARAGAEVAVEQTTRVGRWMSQVEYDAMKTSGKVQESFSGTTHVANPADAAAFIRQAESGSLYVEFNVPTLSLKVTNEGWAKIIGSNSLEGRLAGRKGLPIPQMPNATNILHSATKIP